MYMFVFSSLFLKCLFLVSHFENMLFIVPHANTVKLGAEMSN